jgi:glycosyltransferase involved in cell wall biosynthesis
MKVSIITATYNSGKTLRHTIESVLHQSYQDIEYIIVDGGSKDNTLAILREYEIRFQGRLRYVSEPDQGLYDAMNKGIIMATGELVGILNSDDFLNDAGVIQMVVDCMSSNDVDAIYGDVHYVNDEDLSKCVRYYSSRIFSRGMMRLGFMPAHPSFYCKTKIYHDKGLFNLNFKQAADFELLLRLIYCEQIKTQYLPYDFVTMRTGGLSTSGFESHKAIMKDHRRALALNHVGSSYVLLALRYVYKLAELVASKFIKVAPLPDYIVR